ncbi:MAG TPA: hypothetical protein IAB44_04480 [Candidatus Limivivens intestinipullorum]|uniref:Uncharacterized protein n=1 Tax=Candidatus Limivivens intestinipullorum TaxID=2840858 RepID=A0A9D1ERS0_9FIRM|nr:hypothetical protein [Candidatus Limivivens intestinipullorum]
MHHPSADTASYESRRRLAEAAVFSCVFSAHGNRMPVAVALRSKPRTPAVFGVRTGSPMRMASNHETYFHGIPKVPADSRKQEPAAVNFYKGQLRAALNFYKISLTVCRKSGYDRDTETLLILSDNFF